MLFRVTVIELPGTMNSALVAGMTMETLTPATEESGSAGPAAEVNEIVAAGASPHVTTKSDTDSPMGILGFNAISKEVDRTIAVGLSPRLVTDYEARCDPMRNKAEYPSEILRWRP